MTSELEGRLRQRMEHATAQIQVPHGLAREAARHRRRRIMTQAGAAAATAGAVAAAAVVAGTSGAARDTGTVVTARLASNIESALDAAVTSDDIVHLRNTNGLEDDWYYRGPQQELTRTMVISKYGQPLSDFASTETPTRSTNTNVDYGDKVWWALAWKRDGMTTPPPRQTSCSAPISVNPHQDPATLAANVREALACGQLTNEGIENTNGVNAIKLISVRRAQPPHPPAVYAVTLWVDPVTYLPTRWQSSTTALGHTFGWDQNITWLPPTSANLAQLRVSIPTGFTHVPPPQAQSGSR
ncbi:MAG TPA: hypothetical protein VF070_07755 [Streptosporangiaceae bacterium]